MDDKTIKELKKELILHAHALDIPEGASDAFINSTIKSVEKSLKSKSNVTPFDIKKTTLKELKKYHPDLAYVYEIHDTII